jgi:uncharacterized protein (TIGR03382 family)
MRRSELGWALLLAVGCGDASSLELPVIDRDPQIVNGQTTTGHPAVVALTAGGGHFCTGTLIQPTVVLTAAHCLPPHTASFGLTSYSQIDVYFGSNVYGGGGQFVNVVGGWTHPGWNEDVIEDDIGLLRLQTSGPATPIPFREEPMGFGDVGDSVRIIGFGITSQQSPNSGGVKREALSQVSEVYSHVFTMNITPSGTCSGDSGGTALMDLGGTEYVAGIHSRSDCQTVSIDTRVDEYKNEIYAFIGAPIGPSCGPDGTCASGCPAPDPDCPCAADGFCDGSCPDPSSDPDCATNPCAANGICNAQCVDDPDCPPVCVADGLCVAGCVSDPDCGCPADGVCDESCDGLDPDCWRAGVAAEDYDASDGGCAAAGREGSAGWLALLGLFAGLRRRVRSER